jgi:hypothetical protein
MPLSTFERLMRELVLAVGLGLSATVWRVGIDDRTGRLALGLVLRRIVSARELLRLRSE